MGALADILLAGASPIVAFALIVLFVGEGVIAEYVRRRFNRMEDRMDERLNRLEDALIEDALMTDGGLEDREE